MLCEFGCADADSPAVCCLAYHPVCLGLSKAPKEQFVCPRHGRLSTIPPRKLPQKVTLAPAVTVATHHLAGSELHSEMRPQVGWC